jgi:hypothetical protein
MCGCVLEGMGTGEEVKVRTQRENLKAERWNALLEKSAKAEGTLHLGAAGVGEDGLSSGRLRFEESEEGVRD